MVGMSNLRNGNMLGLGLDLVSKCKSLITLPGRSSTSYSRRIPQSINMLSFLGTCLRRFCDVRQVFVRRQFIRQSEAN